MPPYVLVQRELEARGQGVREQAADPDNRPGARRLTGCAEFRLRRRQLLSECDQVHLPQLLVQRTFCQSPVGAGQPELLTMEDDMTDEGRFPHRSPALGHLPHGFVYPRRCSVTAAACEVRWPRVGGRFWTGRRNSRSKNPCFSGWLTGLEPATLGTTNRCSNQLSYSHRAAASLRPPRHRQIIPRGGPPSTPAAGSRSRSSPGRR